MLSMAREDAPEVGKSVFWTETNRDLSQPSTDLPHEDFERSSQLRHMLSRSLLRWLITVTLASSIYGILWSYSQNAALPSRKKQELDTLIIGISIALGVNTASSFKADVRRLRWWLLSLHWYTPREADLILQSEKLGCLVLLGLTSRRWTARLFALTFLVLNVASQVILALLGLAYNISPADRFALTEPGTVLIPDMSDFGPVKEIAEEGYEETPEALATRQYLANRYGASPYGLKAPSTNPMPQPGTILNPNDPLLYLDSESNIFSYLFYESETMGTTYGSRIATNRSVSVYAECDGWPVVQGGDGFSENITTRAANGTTRVWQLPALKGPDQTMFIYDSMLESGDSWAIVEAFSASTTKPWMHSCNVTITPVVNAVINEHLLGVLLMRSAAPAIALEGSSASPTSSINDTKRYQFQSYPVETFYGLSFEGSNRAMAHKIAQVAISSIAIQAETSSGIERLGMVPVAGISVEVKPWAFVYLILGLTAGLQLSIAIISVLLANRVQVRYHNHLSMAALTQSTPQEASRPTRAADQVQSAGPMDKDRRLMYAPEEDGTFHIRSKQL